ncbi:MAG: uroporphyrinogen decarboxylase [Actinomycetota bacterium]
MRLLSALRREPLDRPPVWFMRQAGRYLPEYLEVRRRHSFQEAVRTPEVAAELTLQPIRRFGLDAAILFSDIMTPLEAMGVAVDFNPGPRLSPMTLEQVAGLPEFDVERVAFVPDALSKVRAGLSDDVALIGFAGGPITLLAYLLEGGAGKEFPALRGALYRAPELAAEALAKLGLGMRAYLSTQIAAGADVVQLFDSWAGLLPIKGFDRFAVPAARTALDGLQAPTIYFAPDAAHLLDRFGAVGATGYGVDWRLPLASAWDRLGAGWVIQGNLDPMVLLSDPVTVAFETGRVLEEAGGRPGHIFNLGHGINPATPVENVEAMVRTVRGEGS